MVGTPELLIDSAVFNIPRFHIGAAPRPPMQTHLCDGRKNATRNRNVGIRLFNEENTYEWYGQERQNLSWHVTFSFDS